VGKYTLRALTAGEYISLNDVASTPALSPPPSGVIVPVIVKAEYGRILKQGMRLIFIRNDSVIPVKDELSGQANPPGLCLQAIVLSPDKLSSTIVLMVELRQNQIKYASLLTSFDWTPVAIGP
jgi:hypothetical protein